MKRNILKATLVAAIALVASVNVYNAQKPDKEMSDAALANVEALASGETTNSDCDFYCEPDTRYTCIIIYYGDVEGVTCPDYRKKRK